MLGSAGVEDGGQSSHSSQGGLLPWARDIFAFKHVFIQRLRRWD